MILLFRNDKNISLFVKLLVLVFTTEGFHLELHGTFLSNTQESMRTSRYTWSEYLDHQLLRLMNPAKL